MIRIFRDKNQVRLDFDAFIPSYESRSFHFLWNSNNEIFAGLLAAHLSTVLGDTLKSIRQHAYEQGWRDAKAKRCKETWFARWW